MSTLTKAMRWLRPLVWTLLPSLCITASCGDKRPAVLTHDAYIWKRRWTPALADAIRDASDLVRTWRILAAETGPDGRLHATDPDWSLLERTDTPVIAVMRIDGSLAYLSEDAIADDIAIQLGHWREHHVTLSGLEIDYDSPTRQLDQYARFLSRLRHGRKNDLALSITVLPTWIGTPELNSVLAEIDEAVLQVHAVRPSPAPIFDPAVAVKWISDFGRLGRTRFRIALPTYGVRFDQREDGAPIATESEMPLLAGGTNGTEAIVSPAEMSSFLRILERNPPNRLDGIVWFRLPTADDRRAWSIATWRAVIQGTATDSRLQIDVESSNDMQGMSILYLKNAGEIDAPLPKRIELPAACMIADGANGFTLERSEDHLVLTRQTGLPLHQHVRRAVGWVRCDVAPGSIHVIP